MAAQSGVRLLPLLPLLIPGCRGGVEKEEPESLSPHGRAFRTDQREIALRSSRLGGPRGRVNKRRPSPNTHLTQRAELDSSPLQHRSRDNQFRQLISPT
jgi:hypothetical protein